MITNLNYRLVMIGHKQGSPISNTKRMLVKKPGQYLPRLLIFFAGVVWIKVERPKVDYTKYLGPEW